MKENQNRWAIGLAPISQQIGDVKYGDPYRTILHSLFKMGYWEMFIDKLQWLKEWML